MERKEKRISVTIDFEESGYSASSEDIKGVLLLSEGETIEEVKREMLEVIEEVASMDEYSSQFKNGYSVDWSLSVSSFLNKFAPVLSQSGLSELSGINASLLSAYKSGLKRPRKNQVEKLQKAVYQLAEELLSTPLSV